MNEIVRNMELKTISNQLNQAKHLVQTKNELIQDIEKIKEVLKNVLVAKSKYEKVLIACTNGLNSYKEERLKCLEEQVKENLKVVFPEDDFNVKFETSTYRGKETIDFYTGHGNKLFPTVMQNGRLFRQICSFSISTMIQVLAGCEILIMDEAINSGDIESTKIVSNLIHNLIDNNYQVILIEHKDALYRELPRIQYNLTRDSKTNKVSEVIRNDYTGEFKDLSNP